MSKTVDLFINLKITTLVWGIFQKNHSHTSTLPVFTQICHVLCANKAAQLKTSIGLQNFSKKETC